MARKPIERNEEALIYIEDVRKRYSAKKTFRDPEDFIEQWDAYMEHCKDGHYEEAPTVSNFARWMGIPKANVYSYIRNHSLRERVADTMADCLVEGAMKQKYGVTMAIFTLKNRCGWADKRETSTITGERKIASADEAKARVIAAAKVFRHEA